MHGPYPLMIINFKVLKWILCFKKEPLFFLTERLCTPFSFMTVLELEDKARAEEIPKVRITLLRG